jgi:hypothetical protein
MRNKLIEFLVAIAARLARHEDVKACLEMSLADIRFWHGGAPLVAKL